MVSKFVSGRTAVFIDASNIFFSQKSLGWQIDFIKLFSYLKSESSLWKVFFYTAYDFSHVKQRKFLDFLSIAGYEVRTKKVKFIKNSKEGTGFNKGNLDVELTIDAVFHRDSFESFLLFSGDSDFEALIKFMKRFKKRCLVLSTKGHVSVELVKQAKYVDIKKLKRFIAK